MVCLHGTSKKRLRRSPKEAPQLGVSQVLNAGWHRQLCNLRGIGTGNLLAWRFMRFVHAWHDFWGGSSKLKRGPSIPHQADLEGHHQASEASGLKIFLDLTGFLEGAASNQGNVI